MRNISAHHSYYYIRTTSNGRHESNDNTSERYDVIDITDVPSHIEMFKKRFPTVCGPSYIIHKHAQNADASLINALKESRCLLNLNSIVDVRDVAGILGLDSHSCCFTASAKSRFHIIEAMSLGINRMTVSYPAEVLRISSVSKTIELVLQIYPDTSGARWAKIIEAANSKGMKIVGITLCRSTCSEHTNETERISQAFSNVREAYDLASMYGLTLTFVDLGYIISDSYQKAAHECSTILEELSDEDEYSDGDQYQEHGGESDDTSEDHAFLRTMLELYLPHSLGLNVFAQHAQYFVPDHSKILKWWGMPKVRRPTPSLHSYLAGGCISSGKSLNKCAYLAYRSKKRQTMTSSSNILESPPAAAQA